MGAENNVGVALLSNCIDSGVWALIDGIYQTLQNFLSNDKNTKISGEVVRSAEKYEGRFSGRWGEVDVIALDGRLYTYSPRNANPLEDFSPLEYKGNNEFKIMGGSDFDSIGETLKYQFDKKGKIKAVYWDYNLMKPFRD